MRNLVMDFYELTMGQAYFDAKVVDNVAYFDVFFRKVPDEGSFVIACGIHKILEYLHNFKLSKDDLDYLRSLHTFSEDFLTYLKTIRFTGDVYAVKEGTIVFPNEPVLTIKAPIIEAQLVETYLLLLFNHNSLIATKANRIVGAAQGRAVMEFGSRRAQGESAAIDGALASCLVGASGTACTETGKEYGVTVLGTMAHSFVQSFDSEFEAFKAYALAFPDNCTLLVDTYDTLKTGIPNAIKTFNEVLKPLGKRLKGIRIDSGDLADLAKKARKMLDAAGCSDTKIVVSNSLDEYVISSLLIQNAPIDSFGVGEKMITAASNPILGGVYKLVAVKEKGKIEPRIKISGNTEKVTNPHFKTIYRLYDQDHKVITDLVCIYNEKAPSGPLEIVEPNSSNITTVINNYEVRPLRIEMMKHGKIVYEVPSLKETQAYVQQELATLYEGARRLEYPRLYVANLSKRLQHVKAKLIKEANS